MPGRRLRRLRPVLVGAAFVLALLGQLWVPANVVQISLIWLVVSGLLALIVLLTAGNLVVEARRYGRGRLPKAVHAFVPTSADGTMGTPVTLVLSGQICSALTFSSRSTMLSI